MSLRLSGKRLVRFTSTISLGKQSGRATITTNKLALNHHHSRMDSTALSASIPSSAAVLNSCDYFLDLAPLEPEPLLQRNLSSKVIKTRVAERVAERNRWPEIQYFPGTMQFMRYLCQNFGDIVTNFKVPDNLDEVFPIQDIDWQALQEPLATLQVTWVGHASLLVQMNGYNILTDPVFSNRCSGVQFAGPKRYRPPAFSVDDLLNNNISIDAILISHNHYDHLDYRSMVDLSKAYPEVTFVVPLGLQSWFELHISRNLKIVQLDWHECYSPLPEIHITAIPMCHWSNRFGWDRDKSLWCGFIIRGEAQKFLFPGDTGWFDGLREIGRRYGPIDLAALPIGAYEPPVLMRASHTNPEEAVEMMTALRVKQAVPIHWGTFPLTLEPVMEPRERLVKAVKAANMKSPAFAPWFIGDTVVCQEK